MDRLLARQLDPNGLEVSNGLGAVPVVFDRIDTKTTHVGINLDAGCTDSLPRSPRHFDSVLSGFQPTDLCRQ